MAARWNSSRMHLGLGAEIAHIVTRHVETRDQLDRLVTAKDCASGSDSDTPFASNRGTRLIAKCRVDHGGETRN